MATSVMPDYHLADGSPGRRFTCPTVQADCPCDYPRPRWGS